MKLSDAILEFPILDRDMIRIRITGPKLVSGHYYEDHILKYHDRSIYEISFFPEKQEWCIKLKNGEGDL